MGDGRSKGGRSNIKKHTSNLTQLFKTVSQGQALWQTFSDFIEMAAIAISNGVDWGQSQDREDKYLTLINKYSEKQRPLFGQMLGELVLAMDAAVKLEGGPIDILGPLYHQLELHNKWTGQFFTPVNICEMMGQLLLGDGHIEQKLKRHGHISLDEPCTGSGAMVLGFVKALHLRNKAFNYQTQLLVSARDIDLKCVHMTYIQLSLYNIPAIVVHGDTISLQEWDRWYTPAYVLGGWPEKIKKPQIAQVEPQQLTLF